MTFSPSASRRRLHLVRLLNHTRSQRKSKSKSDPRSSPRRTLAGSSDPIESLLTLRPESEGADGRPAGEPHRSRRSRVPVQEVPLPGSAVAGSTREFTHHWRARVVSTSAPLPLGATWDFRRRRVRGGSGPARLRSRAECRTAGAGWHHGSRIDGPACASHAFEAVHSVWRFHSYSREQLAQAGMIFGRPSLTLSVNLRLAFAGQDDSLAASTDSPRRHRSRLCPVRDHRVLRASILHVMGSPAPPTPAPSSRRSLARSWRVDQLTAGWMLSPARPRAPPAPRCRSGRDPLHRLADAHELAGPLARPRGLFPPGGHRADLASSAAAGLSVGSVVVIPTPTAGPLMAAITGFVASNMRRVASPPPSRRHQQHRPRGALAPVERLPTAASPLPHSPHGPRRHDDRAPLVVGVGPVEGLDHSAMRRGSSRSGAQAIERSGWWRHRAPSVGICSKAPLLRSALRPCACNRFGSRTVASI